MIKERLRRLFGKANTSSAKSSKRCPACSGHWGPMANKHNSISGLWTISVCDLRISWILVVGPNSSIRMIFQKLQMPSITRFRPELPTRLCTVYVAPTASTVGIISVLSLYMIRREASSNGTACLLTSMNSNKPKAGCAKVKAIWRKHKG